MPRFTRPHAAWIVAAWALFAVFCTPIAHAQAEEEAVDTSSAVAAQIERVKNDPPVHERDVPWEVPVRELELESQPLRLEQLEERTDIWLGILQEKLRERARVSIASDSAGDDAALRSALAAEETRLDAVVSAVVTRVEVLLNLIVERGGDASVQSKYVQKATGLKPNLEDPQVLLTQATSWLKSPDGGIAVGLRIVTFVVLIIVFIIVSRIASSIVRSAVKRISPGASDLLVRVLANSVRRVILIIGLVVAISRLGVDVTPLIAAIGAAGLVIGLAMQGTLSNFASGILILMNRPYDVGDVISAGGVTGKVEEMSLVSTKLLTFDNQVMLVPNDTIWSGVITNITGLSTRRVDMTFGIGYSDDIEKAEAVIREIISGHDKVLAEPAPTIKLHELADSSVNFIVRPWSKTGDYWDVFWDVTKAVKERFDAEGIGIPFPQQDVHFPGPVEVVMRPSEG